MWDPVNINYWIDNTPDSTVAPFFPDGQYNQTLIKKEGLENIQHALKVEISSINQTFLV